MARSGTTDDQQRNGIGATAAMIVANNVLGLLQQMLDRLDRIAGSLDAEPEIDNTVVVGGTFAGAAVVPIQLPRTIIHAEITIGGSVSVAGQGVALLDGNVTLADAQNRMSAGAQVPAAIVATAGGNATARDRLSGVGYLTLYVPVAMTCLINIRVVQLDRSQSFARRS